MQARRLGTREVGLCHVLEAGPQRALAEEVRGDRPASAAAVAELQRVAQVGRDVGRLGLGDVDAQRHDHRAATSGPRQRRAASGGGQRDVVDLRSGARELVDGATHLARARVATRDEHGPERRRLRAVEVAREGVLDALRLRAGHAETAAGQVVGLLGGERQRREERDHPGGDHEPPASLDERVEPEHEPLHG
jgi:hypothetical protein